MTDNGTPKAWRNVRLPASVGKDRMTINEIHETVQAARPCSSRQVRRWIKALDIKPIGCKQNPQPYPDDAPKRILAHLGFDLAKGPSEPKASPGDGRVPSLTRLKQVRAKARRAA